MCRCSLYISKISNISKNLIFSIYSKVSRYFPSLINAINMQKSQSACYIYTRRWVCITLILSCPELRLDYALSVTVLCDFIATVFAAFLVSSFYLYDIVTMVTIVLWYDWLLFKSFNIHICHNVCGVPDSILQDTTGIYVSIASMSLQTCTCMYLQVLVDKRFFD